MHLAEREAKVPFQWEQTTQDVRRWLTESSDCLSRRHTPHSLAGCSQNANSMLEETVLPLLVVDRRQH